MTMGLLLLPIVLAGPNEAQVLLEATQAHVAEGNYARACDTAFAAVDADPENVDALWAAALMAFKLEEYGVTASLLNTLIRLDPYDDEARVLLAQAHRRRGDRDLALQNLDAVLDANPAYKSAVELKEQLLRSAADDESPWRHFARASLGVGYDSNVALTADDLPAVSRLDAPLAGVDLEAGALAPRVAVPLTVLATLRAQTSLSDRDNTAAFVPSVAGLAVSGRMPVKGMEALADLRYAEVFTDLFQTHYERQLSPSLSLSPAGAFNHRGRLLLGGDFAILDRGSATPRSVLRATLRDTFAVGRMSFILEAGGRRRMSDDNTGTAPGRFIEGRGLVYVEAPVVEHVEGFVLVSGEAREFERGLKESTYQAQLGARYELDLFEIHAEYSFSKNLSGKLRSYDRHQAGVGVRFWYF